MPVLGQRAFLPAWSLTAGTFKPSGELLESTPVISHLPFHWTAISNLRPPPPPGRHTQPDQTQRSHICLRFGKLAVSGRRQGQFFFSHRPKLNAFKGKTPTLSLTLRNIMNVSGQVFSFCIFPPLEQRSRSSQDGRIDCHCLCRLSVPSYHLRRASQPPSKC